MSYSFVSASEVSSTYSPWRARYPLRRVPVSRRRHLGRGSRSCPILPFSALSANSVKSMPILYPFYQFRRSCPILPFQPILWNLCLPSEPGNTSPKAAPNPFQRGRGQDLAGLGSVSERSRGQFSEGGIIQLETLIRGWHFYRFELFELLYPLIENI